MKGFATRLTKACKRAKILSKILPLGVGDIRFLTSALEIVGIERKSTDGDLFSSLSGRLQDQCLRLTQTVDKPYLLIDGPFYIMRNGNVKGPRYMTNWNYDALLNQFASLQEMGIRVIHCVSKARTPGYVISMYRYWQKEDHTSLLQPRLKAFPTRPMGLTPAEEKLRVLMAIAGIGHVTAKKLLDIYGSVSAVGSSPVEGLASTPGLGKNTAAKIKEVLN